MSAEQRLELARAHGAVLSLCRYGERVVAHLFARRPGHSVYAAAELQDVEFGEDCIWFGSTAFDLLPYELPKARALFPQAPNKPTMREVPHA